MREVLSHSYSVCAIAFAVIFCIGQFPVICSTVRCKAAIAVVLRSELRQRLSLEHIVRLLSRGSFGFFTVRAYVVYEDAVMNNNCRDNLWRHAITDIRKLSGTNVPVDTAHRNSEELV